MYAKNTFIFSKNHVFASYGMTRAALVYDESRGFATPDVRGSLIYTNAVHYDKSLQKKNDS